MNRPALTSPTISENIRGFEAVAALLIVLFFGTACGRTAAADSAAQTLFQRAVGAGIKEAKGTSFAENDFASA